MTAVALGRRRVSCVAQASPLDSPGLPTFQKSPRSASSGDGLAHFGDLHSQVVQSSRQQNQAGLGSSLRTRRRRQQQGLDESTVALVTAEIISALSHIHACGFVFLI